MGMDIAPTGPEGPKWDQFISGGLFILSFALLLYGPSWFSECLTPSSSMGEIPAIDTMSSAYWAFTGTCAAIGVTSFVVLMVLQGKDQTKQNNSGLSSVLPSKAWTNGERVTFFSVWMVVFALLVLAGTSMFVQSSNPELAELFSQCGPYGLTIAGVWFLVSDLITIPRKIRDGQRLLHQAYVQANDHDLIPKITCETVGKSNSAVSNNVGNNSIRPLRVPTRLLDPGIMIRTTRRDFLLPVTVCRCRPCRRFTAGCMKIAWKHHRSSSFGVSSYLR